ncbi:MAG: hypothetical protein M3P18_10815 [Actinomycetota bacterium]|nr:hypothetical protein [Actinomycetota bacterium]
MQRTEDGFLIHRTRDGTAELEADVAGEGAPDVADLKVDELVFPLSVEVDHHERTGLSSAEPPRL